MGLWCSGIHRTRTFLLWHLLFLDSLLLSEGRSQYLRGDLSWDQVEKPIDQDGGHQKHRLVGDNLKQGIREWKGEADEIFLCLTEYEEQRSNIGGSNITWEMITVIGWTIHVCWNIHLLELQRFHKDPSLLSPLGGWARVRSAQNCTTALSWPGDVSFKTSVYTPGTREERFERLQIMIGMFERIDG